MIVLTEEQRGKSGFIEWIVIIAVSIIVALLIKTFILSSTLVMGNSMNPTLLQNDRLFVNKISFMVKNVDRGDIVEIHAPDNPNKDYIKRVIGLPGDTIEIKNKSVYLNGQELYENYVSTNVTEPSNENNKWVVKENEIFVMGDNRYPRESKDSREFGTVSKDSIVGIAFYRYHPFKRMGKV